MRAALQFHPAGAVGRQQRGQHGLQHQHAAAGAGDGKAVVAGADRAWREAQLLRPQFGPIASRPADVDGRAHAGQVLAHQAGLGPLGAYAVNAQRAAGNHGKRQAGAQDLPAAFAFRTIQFYHFSCS
ncbi:hypothetical protein D3C85_1400970 [compost metagenome]